MTPERFNELFQHFHENYRADWLKLRRQVIIDPSANEQHVFQDWVCAQLAAITACFNRLKSEVQPTQGDSNEQHSV